MALSARRSTALACLGYIAVLASPGAAVAQQTAPADRCEGTLCDLYYGGAPPEPQPGQKPAAPKPLTVPQGGIMGFFSGSTATSQPGTQGAPAKRPLVGVGGGGLAAMARGETPERCTGTACDLFYGGPPPDKPEPQAAQPAGDQQAVADPSSAPAPASPGVRYRPLPEEKPRCAAKANDPWSCYR